MSEESGAKRIKGNQAKALIKGQYYIWDYLFLFVLAVVKTLLVEISRAQKGILRM